MDGLDAYSIEEFQAEHVTKGRGYAGLLLTYSRKAHEALLPTYRAALGAAEQLLEDEEAGELARHRRFGLEHQPSAILLALEHARCALAEMIAAQPPRSPVRPAAMAHGLFEL